MKLTLHRFTLPLEHEFTIARGSLTHQRTLIVQLTHDGKSGFGEATEDTYYGQTLDSMTESIERVRNRVETYQFGVPDDLWAAIEPDLHGSYFALSALDMAAHDLFGKLQGQPTYRLWGLEWDRVPESSYTIGIDTIDKMVAKLRERPGWSVYKIKLGTPDDVHIVRELRRHTDAVFRVDANCGWTAEEAIEMSRVLQDLNVEFIEQPLPAAADRDDVRRVFDGSVLPIIADESCVAEADVDRCHGQFHGINVKLCKCGGLTPAVRMLRNARSLGMKTMVGCMVETSVAISAAAQLLPLLDYADLDGAVLLKQDPATGVRVEQGHFHLSKQPGCGTELLDGPTSTLCQ